MKLFPLFLAISNVFAEDFKLSGLFFDCGRDLTFEYHQALQDFSTRLFKQVAIQNNDNFAVSQYSIWLAMSALAESAEGDEKSRLLSILNLPQDDCLREKYYEIALSLESPAEDVTLSRKRLLIVDNELKLNRTWANSVRALGLIDTKTASITNNSTAMDILKYLIKGKLDIKLPSNSILLDSLDYEGLWTTEFEPLLIDYNADFHNDQGETIGRVDLLKVKKRVKLAYIPFLNAKLLELPVGNNGRYRMLFIVNLGKTSIRRTIEHFPASFILDIMPLLIESLVPLEVAIPKFKITSELDLKKALENVGLESIWKSDFGKSIATPPLALSTSYQRVTIDINSKGLGPPPAPHLPPISNLATGLAGVLGRDFVANRPFIYGLVDSQTRTWLFAGAFSHPNYD